MVTNRFPAQYKHLLKNLRLRGLSEQGQRHQLTHVLLGFFDALRVSEADCQVLHVWSLSYLDFCFLGLLSFVLLDPVWFLFWCYLAEHHLSALREHPLDFFLVAICECRCFAFEYAISNFRAMHI